MIYNLLSYVIYLFHYCDFNFADIDQFSENVTNGAQRPQPCAYFKYSKKINQSSCKKYFDLAIMRTNIEMISLKKIGHFFGGHVTENGA